MGSGLEAPRRARRTSTADRVLRGGGLEAPRTWTADGAFPWGVVSRLLAELVAPGPPTGCSGG
ncbi:hypothetical protein HMPREF0063_10363 [Aeromicrobium marinum DSM 15272]|uniref:Uncharacterized protein n=1 Tax=Aeromicrobium marinum DSM 15272 TaxID=585531 RepID=E2S8K6_9ACTN|nr:hypothetical protein HMPREF0063_10363 [Aeromicrobium marinum DSM 15272]